MGPGNDRVLSVQEITQMTRASIQGALEKVSNMWYDGDIDAEEMSRRVKGILRAAMLIRK